MVIAWLVTRPRPGPGPLFALVPLGALATALNPLIGLSAAGALAAASLLLWVLERRRRWQGWSSGAMVARSGAVLSGALAAWPSYAHLLAFSQSAELPDAAWIVIKSASIVTGFLVLVPLALWGVKHGPEAARPGLATVTCAGLLLIAVVPVLGLPEGNQHNFLNAAGCLLAVPAAAWVCGADARDTRVRRRAVMATLVFVPTTMCMAIAFSGRGPLPLAFENGILLRTPVGGPLESFYRWARTETPERAVLICDPERPVKMSGNVSEIPAFTSRALLVDHLTYMTAPYPDREQRTDIARDAVTGRPLTQVQRDHLDTLDRPLFVVTFAAQDDGVIAGLTAQYGAPVFQQEFVAAFALDPVRGR
jgi:hypothetical protein